VASVTSTITNICKVHFKKIHSTAELCSLSDIFSRLEGVVIFGGNRASEGLSYWMAEPIEVFKFDVKEDGPFEKLGGLLGKYKLDVNVESWQPKGIFTGGWAGYFSYELGRYIEKIPETVADDISMPLIRLGFYDKFVAYDHKTEQFWLGAVELPKDEKSVNEKFVQLGGLVSKAEETTVEAPAEADLDSIDLSKFKCNMEKEYYLKAIEKIKRHIFDGDVYQINFSQRFECDFAAEAIRLFHWQNFHNPSPYAAYIDADDFKVVSASPEMYVTIADGVISTKPIKGTRRRVNEKNADEKNFAELVNSEKEQAELNMIVDLERNDLAKICKAGTRKVIQPRSIETYPTVFHAVATVAGELKDGISFCDVLKAMFPGGSITGAPKVAAMEIIDDAEPTARGVYTGSIGLVGLDGNVCLNIAIRTIIIKGGKAYAQTGGGIVADSDAQAEWNETITKARALLAGIRAVK